MDIPIYVTRKNANGATGTLSVSPYLYAALALLLLANLVGWGTYSLVVLAERVIDLF